MNIHHCLLCLGSNYEYSVHLQSARGSLELIFPDILFGEEMVTEAIGDKWLSPFGNQLARFTTSLGIEEIRSIFKHIEKELGRLPEDKTKGIVKIDIDLLMFDEKVLKPEDMKREFVIKGIRIL